MSKSSEAILLLKIKSVGEEILTKTGDGLSKLGKIAAAAYAAATVAAAAAVHAYREQEEATNSLNQALINQGIYSKDLSARYQKIASDLQKVTLYGDEAIIAAQAQVQTYLGQIKVTKELTKSILDFATAKKIDLHSAAELIGKSIGSNTNVLARHKIEIDENATKAEKMAQVIQQLEKRVGGQAEAAAQGLGSLTVMKNAMGELWEVAGMRLAPVVIYLARVVTEFAESMQTNEGVIRGFDTAIQLLGGGAIVLKNVIFGLGETILGVFTTISSAAAEMYKGGNGVGAAFEKIKTGFADTASIVTKRAVTFGEELLAFDNIFKDAKVKADEEEISNLRISADRRTALLQEESTTRKELFKADSIEEIQRKEDQEKLLQSKELASLQRQFVNAKNHTDQLTAEKKKRDFLDEQYANFERQRVFDLANFKETMNSKGMREFESVLNNMAGMQNSKNAVLVGIGKAAAIAQVAISTARGSVEAYAFGAAIGGPAVGVAMAAPIVAYGLEKSATLAGIQLAEGGLVKATPGGVNAIIGEGGRDEMVIPIEKGQEGMAMGSRINIEVHGGFLGDESQLKEFAVALDRGLLRLRQGNESLAFDKGII